MLDAIASRAAEPELAYATDEDTTFLSPDPRSNRFDMAGDPIEWAESRIAMIDQRLSTLLEWAVKDRESWYHTRAAFGTLLGEKARVLRFVGRYIGGVYTSRSHRGDADAPPPLAVVDGKRQRNALAFIEKNVFQDEFFTFPPELLNHLTVPRWSHRGARVSYVVDYPIHDVIAAVQWSILFDRLFPYTLRRIYDGEMKTDDADRLTAAEYLQRVQSACWPDSMSASSAKRGNWSDASPFMSSIRRSLQREYLNLMEPLVRTPPGWLITPDLHAMVKNSLRKLSGQLDELKGVKLDFASESHLIACKSRIDRMLEPELREY
ncbi:MAG: zinc-dependent metalloprotease [Phycisphaerae bacterium]